jgi:hypothetical protein
VKSHRTTFKLSGGFFARNLAPQKELRNMIDVIVTPEPQAVTQIFATHLHGQTIAFSEVPCYF